MGLANRWERDCDMSAPTLTASAGGAPAATSAVLATVPTYNMRADRCGVHVDADAAAEAACLLQR